MWQFFRRTRQFAAQAKQIAREQGSGMVTEEHLFLVVLNSAQEADAPSQMLAASNISREEARLYAQNALEIRPLKPGRQPRFSPGAHYVLDRAIVEAGNDDNFSVELRHLFVACILPRRGPHLGQTLRTLGLDAERLREQLRAMRRERDPGNPLGQLTPQAEQCLEAARGAMRASFCGRIGEAHLLIGVAKYGSGEVVEALEKAGCDLDELKSRARDSIKSDGEIATPGFRFSHGARRALERAAREARRGKSPQIEPKHLMLGLLSARQTPGGATELWDPALVAALRAALRAAPEKNRLQRARETRTEEFSSRKAVRFGQAAGVLIWSLLAAVTFGTYQLMLTGTASKRQALLMLIAQLTTVAVCAPLTAALEGVTALGSRAWPRQIGGVIMGVALVYGWMHLR